MFRLKRMLVRKAGLVFAVQVFLLLVSVFSIVLNVPLVNGSGTVYIRANGIIDPLTAPISNVDNVTYTLTGNIDDSIVVERSNIVVDGAGYAVQGTYSGAGIDLSSTSNVTIKNTNVNSFLYGIWLTGSSNNSIIENNITVNKWHGIRLYDSSNNNIVKNNITANRYYGIWMYISSNNSIYGNCITKNEDGIFLSSSSNNSIVGNEIRAIRWHSIWLTGSSNNTIIGNNLIGNYYGISLLHGSSNNNLIGNNITATNWDGVYFYESSNNSMFRNNIADNYYGLRLQESSGNSISKNNITNNHNGLWLWGSSNNDIYPNNFVGNCLQVYDSAWDDPSANSSLNVWDDGYPSGGNYWSDFEERYPHIKDICNGPYQNESGSDGIWDGSYVMDANNKDNYPLVEPWLPEDITPPIVTVISPGNRTYSTTNVTLTFIVNEATSWMSYSLDSGANVTIAENTTLTVAEGAYSIIVYANDTAGNMASSPIIRFTVDITSPNIMKVSQFPSKNSVLVEDQVKVNATVTDNLSGVKQVTLNYTTNNGTWFAVEMINLEGNVWSAIIPAFPYSTNVTYVIIAEDNASNAVTTEDLGYTYQYQVIPEFQSLTITPLFIVATLLTVTLCRRRRIYSKQKDIPLQTYAENRNSRIWKSPLAA